MLFYICFLFRVTKYFELILFLAKYLISFALVILGYVAPGVPSLNYDQFDEEVQVYDNKILAEFKNIT